MQSASASPKGRCVILFFGIVVVIIVKEVLHFVKEGAFLFFTGLRGFIVCACLATACT